MIMAASGSVLVVDDELNIRDGIAAALAGDERRIRTASSGAQAVEIIRKSPPFDVIITDLRMRGEIGGLELVKRAHALCPVTAIIVITAYGTIETAVEAMKLGAIDYLAKPLDLKHLRNIVRNAIEKQSLLRENIQLRKRLAGEARIIARSPQMKKVMEIVEQVAASDVTVLITGESGTGKEMVARAIHEKSSRRDGPFVAANCSALPESLFESEMFGHEKGAFTGAVARKPGRFELADGGTLFLDEIGNMSDDFQEMILRVVEYQRFERVQGTQTIEVDVRVLAATNADIEAMMEKGAFRRDLYDRLAFKEVMVPPLRERMEDIPALVQYFLEELCKEVPSIGPKRLTPPALEKLRECPWPGNIRQLKNTVERLALEVSREEIGADSVRVDDSAAAVRGTTFLERVESFQKRMIAQALGDARGNQRAAAKAIGLTYDQLRHYYKKFGLKADR